MAIWTIGGPTARNKPGRQWIRYVGDDAEVVRRRMLDRMRSLFPQWNPRLEALEEGQDYATAFIDAFAHLSDVLAVYQDDHANQSFLGTASRESILTGLAELVDYRPAPGVSASTLQVFLLAENAAFDVVVGQQLEGPADDDGQPLAFEVQVPLAADFLKNELRLEGFDRSTRVFNALGDAPVSRLRLAEEYAGLASGTPLVFASGGVWSAAVPLAASWIEEETTTIEWGTPLALQDASIGLAELEILAKPGTEALSVDAARADELRAGETSSGVQDAFVFSNSSDEVGLLVSGGLMEPIVVRTGGATIHWDRPLTTSLRKSQTIVFRASLVEQLPAGHTPPGFRLRSQAIERSSSTADVKAGDQLIIVDDIGALRQGLSGVTSARYYLSEPLSRRMYGTIRVYRVRMTGAGTSPSSALSSGQLPALTEQLDLVGAVSGLEIGSPVVLGDGEHMSVHALQSVAVMRGQTHVVFSPPTTQPMSLSALRVWSRFGLRMRGSGYDRSDALTVPDTTQLNLQCRPGLLAAGDHLVVSDKEHTEGVRITRVSASDHGVTVDFVPALRHEYRNSELVVFGNVAPVDHGKSVHDELLGSGAKGASSQSFELSKEPLTFVRDGSVEGGAKAALTVSVDGQRLAEVRDLSRSGPSDAHYVVKTKRDQRAKVVAGDGVHGMGLVSGRDNVFGTYRVGLGSAGNVAEHTIAKSKPGIDGLVSTFNALPGGGGEDREGPEDIRVSTPLVTKTLDRAVSLQDYALLARAFAGVAKARADWQLDGLRKVVRLTVGAEGGERASLELKAALADYLKARSSGSHRVAIVDFRPAPLRMVLRISVASDYRRVEVTTRFIRALQEDFFSYEARSLGQAAVLSEVYAIGEGFAGIDGLVAEAFHRQNGPSGVRHRVDIEGDELITGGAADDVDVGTLHVYAEGGLS